ncbi:hypothetical protein ACHAQJ_000966 [Trichoderma viride]
MSHNRNNMTTAKTGGSLAKKLVIQTSNDAHKIRLANQSYIERKDAPLSKSSISSSSSSQRFQLSHQVISFHQQSLLDHQWYLSKCLSPTEPIHIRSDGKFIELEASQPLGRLVIHSFTGGRNQLWRVLKVDRDEYSLLSLATGTYITAPSGVDVTARGSRLSPEDNNVARWTIVRASPNSNNWIISSVAYPNKVLGVAGSSQANLTAITVYPYQGGPDQQFTFTRV